MKNIDQKEVITFKSSVVIKRRLERLSEKNGITNAAFLRVLINQEYVRVFGEE